jgi:hypothetical protein
MAVTYRLFSAVIIGVISDENGVPLPFSSVYVKNSTIGVSANYEGRYFLELPAGNYTLIYSSIGYFSQEKVVKVTEKQHLSIDIHLIQDVSAIDEVEIVADKDDRAKSIMSKVRENRKLYLDAYKNYSSTMYLKSSIEKEYTTSDTVESEGKEFKDINEYLKRDKLNMIEYIAEMYYEKPNRYKEHIIAYHDFTEQKPPGGSITVSAGIDDGDITTGQYSHKNPYLFNCENITGTFNFYENLIDVPTLCNQPMKSPIAESSGLSYRYEYIESFHENSRKIHKLNVIPINANDAFYKGYIFIEDSTWALVAVDLSVNEKALLIHKNFNIIERYKQIDKGIYLPENISIMYTIKEGKTTILGETGIDLKDQKANIEMEGIKFGNEIITFAVDAYDRDSVFWTDTRPVMLKQDELKFIKKTDSLQEYYKSNAYLDRRDSLFNKLYWWSPFVGFGHRNHYLGYEYWIGGILQQVVPFGVGGYRHRLPINFNQELNNGMLLETNEEIDYGFKNADFKGKVGVGLTYIPKKFVRTYVDVGNTYDLVNDYASIEQIFSRSNYVNTKFFQLRQRMEVINGLYAELTFLYSDQNPITDLELERWSDFLFGELNEPIDFKRYTKSEVKLKLQYKLNQKYYFKGNKKVVIGDQYPEAWFIYRKGIPELFNSEVNFDYLEFGATAEHQLARMGESRWQVSCGWFANTHRLRLLEYKFFRGSDRYFFSDPLKSFQLLGPTLNTGNSYWQANYVHHFNGAFLNKIPVINFLKLCEAAGVGALGIPDENFFHVEMFVGLERNIRIKKQVFRLGVYAVTADNTLSDASITWKVGISFFNSYTGRWSY